MGSDPAETGSCSPKSLSLRAARSVLILALAIGSFVRAREWDSRGPLGASQAAGSGFEHGFSSLEFIPELC